MKLLIITVGKKHDPHLVEAINDYTKRLNYFGAAEWQIIKTSDLKTETGKILDSLKPTDFCLLLDEKGKNLTSVELAGLLEKEETNGRSRLVIVIGGAYGVDEKLKQRANLTWSLSKLTLPHQLVRLVVAEQLYRAYTIIKGQKYHHE